MIRTFQTHEIRKQEELTGSLWEFEPCQGPFAGNKYQVATPCCWESHPDFSGYRGEGMYRKKFTAGGNVRLEFKGVSHTATVYLDGREIAHHYNAYTSFSVILQDLQQGEHLLEIKADNRFSEESALHIPNDYMSYGGVSRPVVLEQLGEIFIEYVHVTPYTKDGKWRAKIQTRIAGLNASQKNRTVQVELAGQRFQWETELADMNRVELETELVFKNVQEWLFETPQLYPIKVQAIQDGQIIDDLIDRVGFREIKTEGKKILLNGKQIRLKGFCRHEDHPQFGCALPYAAMAADLDIIWNLGANSVRTVHYPNDEIFLDLCDELGLLVWEENHARGLSLENMQNPNFEPQAENVIREMIPLHYNHPCIFIWGILNECASETEYGRECYQKQFNIIEELDASRLRSFASCKLFSDICFDLPEIVSCNIYPLWYHDTPVGQHIDDLYQWIQKETGGAGKPFLISEIGAGGIYGWRNNYEGKWSEEYQAKALQSQVSECLKYPDCSGVYIWQFCDIRVSEECFAGRPRGMNNKGVVDEYRRRKMGYKVVKKIFESYSNYF